VIARQGEACPFSYICLPTPAMPTIPLPSTTMQPLSTEVDLCELLLSMKLGRPANPAGKSRGGRSKHAARNRHRHVRGTPFRRDLGLPETRFALRAPISRMRVSAGYPVPTRELPHHRRRIHRVYLHPPSNILRLPRGSPILCQGFQ